jgi:intracellular septation protein A
MGLTIVFVILQAIYLARFIQEEEEEENPGDLKED